MTGAEVREMTDEEIVVEMERLRRRVYDLRSQAVTEKLDDPSLIRKTKRDIARLLTEQTARTKKPAAPAQG